MTTAPPITTAVEAPPKKRPEIVIRGKHIPVILPKWSDPRLKLSATIWAITILGLTILRFQLSIPQIAVTVLLCAVIEVVHSYYRDHVLIWPASSLQTGISIAFIWRVAGTEHGDYWSWRGIWLFVLVAVMGMVPKYLIRRANGKHVFNPSNIALAWGLLLIGPSHVFSEHLWWDPLGWRILLAMAVIFGGGYWVLRQVKMIPLATAFLATFLPLIGLWALFGRYYYARWHTGPVGGSFYWVTVALSPEVLIFAFFMITDPQTAPKSSRGRILYGAATGVVAAVLIAIQTTEFAIKVAILTSLLVTCALVPAFEWLAARMEARRHPEVGAAAAAALNAAAPARPGHWLRTSIKRPVAIIIAVIAIAAPLNTALLARDHKIQLIERGLTVRKVQ
jgi:hypothetical protein